MHPATRLMCALERNYLVCEDAHESTGQYSKELDELQCIQFSCSIPVTNRREFIEIEGQGLSSSFFPFIVAEEDVVSEIRVLEPLLELSETDPDIEGTGKIKAKCLATQHHVIRPRVLGLMHSTMLLTVGRFMKKLWCNVAL